MGGGGTNVRRVCLSVSVSVPLLSLIALVAAMLKIFVLISPLLQILWYLYESVDDDDNENIMICYHDV